MEKRKSVELLCAGVSEWNRYREDTMDLSHLEIRNADLSGANFEATNFDGTRFQNVNMSNCNFMESRFNGISATLVDLSSSDFERSEIKGTDLNRCNLNNAKITQVESYLWKNRHTSFIGSKLVPRSLSHVHFYNCNFENCEFIANSIEYTDIKRGQIDRKTESYLAKNGVNFELVRQPNIDDWIDWDMTVIPLSSEEDGVIIYNHEAYWITENRWDVFISYQTSQKEIAEKLAYELSRKGLKVWFDSETLIANDSLLQSINSGLNACPFGVALLSEDYFGRKWTEYELDKLMSKKMIVILHNILPDKAISLFPKLSDKIMLTSELGINSLSQIIFETIRKPPRNLV